MLPQGGNQPHNNMPPYVVLRICQKINDYDDKTISDFTTNITAEFEKVKSEISLYKTNSTAEVERVKSEISIHKINTTAEMGAKQMNMTA